MINEKANIQVTLNSQEAENQLKELQEEMKRLIALKNKAAEAGDIQGWRKFDSELKKVNRSATKLIADHRSLEHTLKNINGASLKDLREAQRALTAQTEKLTRGTQEYAQKSKQLKAVKDEISKINGEYRAQQPLLSRVSDGFNRYFGMATAALASFAGITITAKSAINEFTQFDDKLSDVMKTTGLTKDQVKALNAELAKIDTRSSQEQLLDLARVAGKLGITSQEEILGFVRAADKINVALAEDLGGNTEEAINQLGKLVDIFGLKSNFGIEDSLLKIGSAINSLGAAGTANEAYMVEFAKRLGGIAPSAGISIEKVLGLAATLDELGQTTEVSGTAIAQVIGKMFKETADYAAIAKMEVGEFADLLNTDANEAFIRLLEGAKGSGTGFSELAKNLQGLGLDGARSTAVLGVLASNIDKLREKQSFSNKEFEKGTSLITEFNTKNQNAQAIVDKARKSFAEKQRELGERLAPAYASIISKSSLLIKSLGILIEFLFENRKALLLAGTAIVSYTIAINAHNIATKVYNALTSAATAITKGFNTAVKTNPVGLLVSLLTTAATAFFLFRGKAVQAKDAQDQFNKVVAEGNNLMLQSKNLEERAGIVEKLSKEQLDRLKSDLNIQIKTEEDFHATLLQKLKKRLDEDGQLKMLYERRNQEGLSKLQLVNINAQINARKRALSMELEDQNKTNQQRLNNLKKHLANVDAEMKNRPTDTGDGYVETDFEKIEKAIQSSFTKEQNILKEQFLLKKLTEGEYNREMYALELAHLVTMRELYRQHNEDFVQIEGQIMDKKLAWQQKFDDMLKLSVSLTDNLLGQEQKMFQDIDSEMEKHLDNYSKNLDKETQKTIDSELEKQEARQKAKDAWIKNSVEAGAAAVENAKTVAEAGKAILNTIRQQIRAYLAEAVATAALKALKNVPFPLNLAAAAAAGGAATFLFNKIIPEFYAGGFTGNGHRNEPAGVVHKGEYVVPAHMVSSPAIAPVVSALEFYRKNPMSINISGLNAAYAEGGYAGNASKLKTQIVGDAFGFTGRAADKMQNEAILSLAQAVDRLMKWNPSVSYQKFEKIGGEYDRMVKGSGM
jgi:TP901 family phage tail tape measure protein